MTTEGLDLLDRLNVGAIKEAAVLKDRPQDRFGATHFRADILGTGSDLQVTTRRPQNSNFDQAGVYLSIDVKEILAGRGELGEMQLWVRMPGARRDGKAQQPEDRSEYSRMLLAANESDPSLTGLRQLPGRKNVEFTDEAHKYTYDRGTGKFDEQGKEIWERGIEGTTWYYRCSFRAGSTNGAAANVPSVVPSDAAIERALAMIKDAGPGGIKESEFNLACTKDSIIKADRSMPKYLTEGKLVAEHGAFIERQGSNLVWVGD